MATHIGNEGVVQIGSSTVIAEVTGFSLTETAAVADDSALGDAADTHIPGSTSWSGEVSCHWDETDTNGQVTLRAGVSVTLKLMPEGSTTGDKIYTGTATVTSFSVNTARNDSVKATFSFTGNGALTLGTA
jgi:hypothetical protein